MSSVPLSIRQKRPALRRNAILRRQLFHKLDRMQSCHLTVVKGGAGSGKTTLLTSYINTVAPGRVCWLSLDESANAPLLFWSQVAHTLAAPGAGEDFLAFFDADLSHDNLYTSLALLCDNLPGADTILVLDDFHLITGEDTLRSVEFFVQNTPPELHIVLLSRLEPPLYLGGLAMEGGLLVLDEGDLTLTEEEALQFLRETLAMPFGDQALRTMAELAEGWIGGLQLIAAAAFGKGEEEIAGLKLSGSLISEYISREIFAALTQEEQDFLLATAPVSYFGGGICRALLPGCDFDRMMEGLGQKNLLLQVLDEEQGLYRYHHILKEYLQHRFSRLPQEKQRQVHAAAALAYEGEGDTVEALHHLSLIQDWDNAIRLLLAAPQTPATLPYIAAMPMEAAVENVDFAYQKFFYHYSNVEFEPCRRLYALMEEQGFEEESRRAFRDLKFLYSNDVADFEPEMPGIAEVERLPLSATSKVMVLVKNASMLYYHSRYQSALEYLERALAYPEAIRNDFLHLYVLNIRAQVLEEMGHLRQALALYGRMEALLSGNKGLRLLWPSYYIGITGVHLKQLRLDQGEKSLAAAREQVTADIAWFDRSYQYNQVEYLFLSGRTDEAMELLLRMVSEEPSANLLTMAGLFKHALGTGRLPASLLESYGRQWEETGGLRCNLEVRLFAVRLLLRSGDIENALAELEDILGLSRKAKLYYRIVEGGLIRLSVLEEAPLSQREAENLWREVLHYAASEEIVLLFQLEKETVLALEAQMEPDFHRKLDEAERRFLQKVLTLCGKKECSGLLSGREQEVLQELAAGLSNKEIGEQLHISLATVKTHIINIYGKLGVNTRVGAAAAARKLGL